MNFSPEVLRKRVDEWVNNGGKEQLAEAAKRSAAAGKAVQETMRVDRSTLDKPMTI